MVREREWCQTTKTYAESSIKACEQRRHKLNVSWTTSDWPSSSSTTTWPPWAPTKINCCLQMRWAAAIWSRADGNHDVQSNVLRSAIVLSLLTSVLMRLNGIAMNNWYPQWRDNITHCRGFKSQAQWFSTKRLSLSLSISIKDNGNGNGFYIPLPPNGTLSTLDWANSWVWYHRPRTEWSDLVAYTMNHLTVQHTHQKQTKCCCHRNEQIDNNATRANRQK